MDTGTNALGPEAPTKTRPFPWWAIFMVAFGGYWLVSELGIFSMNWGLIGPLAILIVGLGMLFSWRRNGPGCVGCR